MKAQFTGAAPGVAALALTLTVALISDAANAADLEALPDYANATLTGDWNGWRSEWARRGADLDLDLKSDWLRNRGGESDGGRPMNQFDARLNADLDKLWGWAATRAYIHFLADWGDAVNAKHTGSLIGVSNIEWSIATTRFFEAWMEKGFSRDECRVLVGLYPFDSEFAVVDSAAVFINPSFGASPDVSLTRGPSIFNNSSFGVRLKWQASASPFYLQAALLDGVPGDPAHSHGTHIKFAKGDGTFRIFESGFTRTNGDFSKLAVGYWGYTARVDDLTDVDASGNPVKRRSSGWYALGEQTVWHGDEDESLAVFARHCVTDGDSTAIDQALNIGLHWRAPFPARPEDIAGIGATRAHIGAKYRQAQAGAGIATSDNESILELTYRASINRWLAVQPVAERLRDPGARRRDATVVGARLEFAL
jgi:porin